MSVQGKEQSAVLSAADAAYEQVRAICREHGLRLTPQRVDVLRSIVGRKDHPTVEDVHERVKELSPSMTLDTVYRTLATFEACGLVQKVVAEGEPCRYDPDTSVHHHILCTKCRRVYDFDWEEFDHMPLPAPLQDWGEVEHKRLALSGVCKDCLPS